MLNDISNIKQIALEIVDTIRQKNTDYGDAFAQIWTDEGDVAGGIHIKEKANRICTLIRQEAQVKGESLDDALRDCAGYCLLLLDLRDQLRLQQSHGKTEQQDAPSGADSGTDQPSHSVAEVADAAPAPSPKKRGGRTAGTKAKSAAGGKRTAKGTRKSVSPATGRGKGGRRKASSADTVDSDSVPEWGSEAEAAAVADFRAAGGFAITDDLDPNDPIFRD